MQSDRVGVSRLRCLTCGEKSPDQHNDCKLVPLQALASSDNFEGAAEMLSCSRTNVSILTGNLEFELGRFVASESASQRSVGSDDGKLKLVHYRRNIGMQITPAGDFRAPPESLFCTI